MAPQVRFELTTLRLTEAAPEIEGVRPRTMRMMRVNDLRPVERTSINPHRSPWNGVFRGVGSQTVSHVAAEPPLLELAQWRRNRVQRAVRHCGAGHRDSQVVFARLRISMHGAESVVLSHQHTAPGRCLVMAASARGPGCARRSWRRAQRMSPSSGCPDAPGPPCPSARRPSWCSSRRPTRRRW